MANELTHFDASGNAHMVDVSEKKETERIARASGRILVSPAVYEAIGSGTAKKGDVLGVARIAGIMAAKKTSDAIPLCHPLPLTRVSIDFDLLPEASAVEARAEVKTRGVGSFAEARTTVTREKQAFLISAANAYIRQRALDLEVRYDILALDIEADGSYTIEHIPSAFYPQLAGHRTGRKSGRPHR